MPKGQTTVFIVSAGRRTHYLDHESVDFTERLGLIVYMLSLITSLYYSIIHLFSLMSEANKPLDCNDDNKTPSVVGPKVLK